MLDLSLLTVEQRQAVMAPDGPLLILAGPGTGKTTVLAGRIAYLVLVKDVAPASILAIAFTRVAARQLRARLAGMLHEQARHVDVFTFHALGLRIIRQWSEELGFSARQLGVFSEDESRQLLAELAAAEPTPTRAGDLADLVRAVQRYRLDGEFETDAVPALAKSYEAVLQRRNAVDFTSMLALPLRLLGSLPAARELYRDAYRYVSVDEFQDVSHTQYALLRRLVEGHGNLAVVGDAAQTLYSWRGADVRFLERFQTDFAGARTVTLDENFRSTAKIVELANAVGRGLPYRRQLSTANPPGLAPILFAASDERAEATFVAGEIERLLTARQVERGGEIAVLYRTNEQALELTLVLRSERIPYRVRGSGHLLARREIRDAVAYLRVIDNPADAVALARIVNVPPRRLARLAALLRTEPAPCTALADLARPLGPQAVASAQALVEWLQAAHTERQARSPAALLELVLEGGGYLSWLQQRPDGSARMENLRRLGQLLAREDDLTQWLADVQLGEDVESDADDAERVLLTTIHGAKGAEWRAVFVMGAEENLLPHYRAIALDGVDAGAMEEEMRVAYVAVTRARERLYVSYCRERGRGGQTQPRRPSRFLTGVPAGLLARAA
jgi:DNA helicase-2/ATP-dependent DNA helicase PcrA